MPGAPEADASAAVEEAPAERSREMRSPRDMVLSLAVLIVPIAILLVIYRTLFSGDTPVNIDPGPKIEEAQQAKVFPIAVPGDLGKNWSAASATFTRAAGGATLRIGYVDPDKDPIQLVESNVPAATLLPSELGTTAKPVSNFRAANGVWRMFDGRPGERALVLTDDTRTIIVTGKADAPSLEHLASSLG